MFGFLSEAKAVKGRVQTLVQLNLELAKLEGKQKVTSLGVAGGLGIAAAVLVVYAIGFAFATAAAGLSEAFPGVAVALDRHGSHPARRCNPRIPCCSLCS